MANDELNLFALAQHFSDEDKAREFIEKLRWPDGPVCPHCGEIDNAYRLEPKPSKKGTHVRKGVWKCGGCREQFTVTVGTIFEDSHIPLSKWLLAYHLLCASKKGMSAHQLHRMLKVTYRSAWFMAHRIRYTMSQEPLSPKLTGIIEIDETYVGGKVRIHTPTAVRPGVRAKDRPSQYANKAPVVSVLQRNGRVQSRYVPKVTAENLRPMVEEKQLTQDELRAINFVAEHGAISVSDLQRLTGRTWPSAKKLLMGLVDQRLLDHQIRTGPDIERDPQARFILRKANGKENGKSK
jgi:transposase-like protein